MSQEKPKIKFVKRANLWCRTSFKYKDGKIKWDTKWFSTKAEAENYKE